MWIGKCVRGKFCGNVREEPPPDQYEPEKCSHTLDLFELYMLESLQPLSVFKELFNLKAEVVVPYDRIAV